ncbi:hypothetical protein [Acidaminobacter hydrogenoformans]|uniref:Uncharacterized protein n=1 Tax=Acidaminobacter hydrogenoformans DSM 2784 TaxID=1120920 RepID=A0A1G5RSP1_9FIRM|nr:hypothetical protein [Acidaminobacter hydrogenoformans]SCZ77102.1 hypothetical protein SAMN03080599_00565 [Acidaminobacter hydrogenoformans DSM 2784]
MSVSLYYPNSEYLAALELASLSYDLITFRLRLFSDEVLWRNSVLAESFSGIAAAPRSVLEATRLNESTKVIVLTEQYCSDTNAFCIYDPIDKMNQLVWSMLSVEGLFSEDRGLNCLFSFAAYHQQGHSFASLKSQLRLHMPLASIVDVTSLTGLTFQADGELSDWLWQDAKSALKEGRCYALAYNPQDLIVTTMPEWKEKLASAVQRAVHPIWFWCGAEWGTLLFKLMPQIKSLCWICEHPKDFELAEKWMSFIKSQQSGTAGYLISRRGSYDSDDFIRKGTLDGRFESIDDYVRFAATGGKL